MGIHIAVAQDQHHPEIRTQNKQTDRLVTRSQRCMKTQRNEAQERTTRKTCGKVFVKGVCVIVRKGHPKKHKRSQGHSKCQEQLDTQESVLHPRPQTHRCKHLRKQDA